MTDWITKKENKKNPKTQTKPRKAVLTVKEKDLPELETLELITDDKLIELTKPKNMKTGGRVNAKDGGCMQIKGWGKARKR